RVATGKSQPAIVRAESHAGDVVRLAADGKDLGATGRVPDLAGRTPGRGDAAFALDEGLPLFAQGGPEPGTDAIHSAHLYFVAGHCPTFVGQPNLDNPVNRSRGQPPAGAVIRNALHTRTVRLSPRHVRQRAFEAAGLYVPDLDGVVPAGRGHVHAVRAKGHGPNRALVTFFPAQ